MSKACLIDISGKDEIGEFGEGMKGVRAAIEELLHVAQTSSKTRLRRKRIRIWPRN